MDAMLIGTVFVLAMMALASLVMTCVMIVDMIRYDGLALLPLPLLALGMAGFFGGMAWHLWTKGFTG